MPAEDNKALARRYFEEVWNRGNVAAVDELIAANYVGHFSLPTNVTVPAQWQLGLEQIKQFVSQFSTTFPDLYFTAELQVAEGDLVVTRGTFSGTHKGEYRGQTYKHIPPTGKQVTWTETMINRIADGKIVELWFNEDTVGLLQQLGVIPAPGQAS